MAVFTPVCLSHPQPTVTFSSQPFSFPQLCAGPWFPRNFLWFSLSMVLCQHFSQAGCPKCPWQHPTPLVSTPRIETLSSASLSPTPRPCLQCFRHLACQLFPEPSLTSCIALLWPVLQPERQPMRTFPPYPEEVLRAPPDTQPASRYDLTPGPVARCCSMHKALATSVSFPPPFRNTWKITSTAS